MKKNSDRPVLILVALTGLATLVTQLLIIRECIAQFSGNEFVITLILFIWLFLGAVGNRVSRLIDKFFPAAENGLIRISIAIAVLPVLLLYALRLFRDFFFIHGTNVGFYPTFTFIFLCMAPYGLLVGIALPYSLFVLKKKCPDYPGTTIYLMDNLGNVIGGILFSFALIFFTTPMQSLLIVGFLLLVSVCFLIRTRPSGKWTALFAVFMATAILALGLFPEKASLLPGEGEQTYYKESRYGRILLMADRDQYTLYTDGNPVLFSQDIPLAEETVHYPLCQLENANQILLIGARSGIMSELEKYQPETIDYVELNPHMSTVLIRYGLIQYDSEALHIINEDGRAYLLETNKTYDAIVLNLPDPSTFQVNRFFTDRFFGLAKKHLNNGGILSFSVPGYDNYLSEPLREKLSSLFNTVSDYFDYVTLLPGTNIIFLCSNRPLHLDIPEQLSEKKIPTLYISRFYRGNMTPERVRQLNELMDSSIRKNEDLKPHLIFLMFKNWFFLHQTSPVGFAFAAAIILIVFLLIMGKCEFVLFSSGFALMGSEILTIFVVQIFFGYIYSQIGLIVTVFLAGLFPGAWMGHRWKKDIKRLIMAIDAALILLLLIFLFVVGFEKWQPPLLFFILMGFAASTACGCQFPLALALIKDDKTGAVRSFSADLIGAAFGTLLTSLVFIPLLGIIGSAWALIGLKCLSMIRVVFNRPIPFALK